MSVGIIFDADIKNGGSYQMSINNLQNFKKIFTEENLDLFIFTQRKEPVLDMLNIDYFIIKLTFIDYIFIIFRNIFFLNYLLAKLNCVSNFEKKLLNNNISLIIFLFVSYKAFLLKKINFISTILDTCHRDFKNFPEITKKVFFFREYINKKILPISWLIITESDLLKEKIFNFYNLNLEKIIAISNLPSILIFNNKNISFDDIKKKFNITSDFYFYPAQFWFHKNHKIILDAVKKLKDRNVSINFLFCGRDKGNLNLIKKRILQLEIGENIKILDYVTDKEIFALYKICKALVMPTYFGPTNIPPVEAWSLDVPVAYSSHLRQHGKDAALYFNPSSCDELVEVLLELEKSSVREKLIRNGRNRLQELVEHNIAGNQLIVNKIKENILKI